MMLHFINQNGQNHFNEKKHKLERNSKGIIMDLHKINVYVGSRKTPEK